MAQVIGASEAVGLIRDNACVFFGGSGGGHAVPEMLIEALRDRFAAEGTPRGLKIRPDGAGGLVLDQDGAVEKWVPGVQQLTFNGKYARERGQQVLFVTDRAVFDLSADGILLTEIAPGISLQHHVLARIGFPVRVAPDLKPMDARLFRAEPMGLLAEFAARAPIPRGAHYSFRKRTP
jgi:acyl CoA:acetate/3-ketoacid CoA transferase